MNLKHTATLRSSGVFAVRGFTLIEMLVYMSLAFLVLGLASAAMYKSMDASAGLRRNSTDIARALSAGEQWRDDVRHAAAPPRLEKSGETEIIFHIPLSHSEVAYAFSSNAVIRRVGDGNWVPVLEHVKDSNFTEDQRQKVLAWRWEVELQSYRKAMTRTRPLFTFIAVPPHSAK
jgi:type II secretory pathway component PulJ